MARGQKVTGYGFRASWASLSIVASCFGCGGMTDVSGADGPCVPGEQLACACPGGAVGAQLCEASGERFGECFGCPDAGGAAGTGNTGGSSGSAGGTGGSGVGGTGTGGIGVGGSDVGGTGNSGGAGGVGGSGVGGTGNSGGTGGGTDSGESTLLSAGEQRLIATFPTERGVLIVLDNAVELVDRTGTLLERWESEREITAAASDGAVLAVADLAKLSTFDLDLQLVASGVLAESCAASVMVSGGRFICGPSADWDRIFYTYATSTASLIASSLKYTYNGTPMRRIPGTDDFVTVTTDSSPSDFHLYSVAQTGEAIYVNESPYHGDFRVTNVYGFDGFDGAPPAHLVTDSGLLLRIYGTNCAAGSTFTSECFVKDGVLGTLSGDQLFLGMGEGAPGMLAALMSPSGVSWLGPLCENGCYAQRIDVINRSVISQHIYHRTLQRVVTAQHDAQSDHLLLGFQVSGDSFGDTNSAYRVELMEY